jgi:predicted DNA-binding protein (MmcQ/YjbR family)
MQKGNYEGGSPSLWLKAVEGAQDVLIPSAPDRFFVPPYVGHKGWIGIHLNGRRIDWSEIGTLVRQSYQLIAPKRLVEKLRSPEA